MAGAPGGTWPAMLCELGSAQRPGHGGFCRPRAGSGGRAFTHPGLQDGRGEGEGLGNIVGRGEWLGAGLGARFGRGERLGAGLGPRVMRGEGLGARIGLGDGLGATVGLGEGLGATVGLAGFP